MRPSKRKALEAQGWKVGDTAGFLQLSVEQRQLLDLRLVIARSVRRQRELAGLSQKQLGERLQTSQPRVAKIEQGTADVSLDQLVSALLAAGGRLVTRLHSPTPAKPKQLSTSNRHVAIEVLVSAPE